ncbi:MAG: glycosyltransferase [Elusimicrobiota bacterium]
MRYLFLRGFVPTDRDPSQIMFDNLSECDDVWTQLFSEISKGHYGEIWYAGGKRRVKYRQDFIERWIPRLSCTKYDFRPDIIFARGGFKGYDQVMKRNKGAFKIYYGAGKRFYPVSSFKKYHLILNDTKNQLKKTKSLFPRSNVQFMLKPAADNIFKPVNNVKKKYDIIQVANENKKRDIKGHAFAISHVPENMKFIKVGIALKKTKNKNKHIIFTNWIPRKKIPMLYSQSKVAIVCCNNVDSAPRVLVEAMACGCPVLVLDSVNFWRNKYITEQTGKICSKKDFVASIKNMILKYNQYKSYKYYHDNLSLKCAANYIKSLVFKK